MPRSLFGRLMLIWLLGLTLVLAVSLAGSSSASASASGATRMFEHMALDVRSPASPSWRACLDGMSPP
jgi:hypothetical protein